MQGGSMLKVGVIGCGYWGPNLIRNFYRQPDVELVAVADFDDARLNFVRDNYPVVGTVHDAADIIGNPEIDAVVIATPVASHYPLALLALEAGKHVFVEKPLATSVVECDRLIAVAVARGLVLYTDHVFVHTGAVRKIRQLIDAGTIGDLYYYDSARINLGLFQKDVNVIWDLAVHDLSILNYITPQRPTAVSATVHQHVPGAQANMAAITLFYDSSFVAHLTVNWMSPVKVRRTLIGGSRQMIVYDDVEPSQKIMVYEKGIDLHTPNDGGEDIRISYRAGDVWGPKLEGGEALDRSAAHFIDCVQTGKTPVTDGRSGRDVVRMMEGAMISARTEGARVELSQVGGQVGRANIRHAVERDRQYERARRNAS
jgi:predicted dehydrogenase